MSKFRVVLNAWLLALTLFCVIAVPIFAAYSDCAYYLTVTVSNNSSTAYPNLRVVYDVNPASLVAGGYMQVDADDIYLTSSSSVLYSTALNMTGDGVHWLGVVNAPAHSNQQLRLYTGWGAAAGRNQGWCADDGDVGTVADAASLDISTNLTVSANVTLSSLPIGATEAPIFVKPGAYYFFANSTSYNFGVVKGATTTEILYPDSAGNVTNISTQFPASTSHWDKVDEVVADDNTTYVKSGSTSYQWDSYGLSPAVANNKGIISSVSVTYRDASFAQNRSDQHSRIGLRFPDVTEILGTERHPASTPTWTNWTETIGRPGGGSWAWSDFSTLEVSLGLQTSSTEPADIPYCTQVYVTVTYYPYVEVGYAAAVGTLQSVKGAYNGTAVGIYKDGILQNSVAVSGALSTSSDNVACLGFDGICDDLRVGSASISSPTWVATYPFEAAQVNSGQIMDQSGNGNTITYTLGGMPSGTGTAVGPLIPITLYVSMSTNGTAASEPAVIPPFDIPLYENTTATGSNLLGYDIFLRGASSLGWSSATLYSVMFMEAAIAFGFAATIGTGTLFFGALAGMGLLTLGAATGLLAWWIPLILGLLTFMAITVFKEL